MSGRWFRFYDGALDDPKVQQLPGELFKAWVNILCAASRREGLLPDRAGLAFMLRKSEKATDEIVAKLASVGLVDVTEEGPTPHNWNGRQYKSDVSNERVKRFRQRQCNVTETPSESEQIQNRTDPVAKATGECAARQRSPTPKLGKRIPENWRPNDAGRAFAADRGIDPDSTADAFADYWASANGPTSVKRDWDAAFRTWCRRDSNNPNGSLAKATARPVRSPRGNDAFFERLADIRTRSLNDEPVRE